MLNTVSHGDVLWELHKKNVNLETNYDIAENDEQHQIAAVTTNQKNVLHLVYWIII